MELNEYPGILSRAKAGVIDVVFIIVMMIGVAKVVALTDNVSDELRAAAFIFIFFLYDPLFTSLFGGTIGHMISGITVRRESNPKQKVIFPLAILRFIIKSSLGLLSLLIVFRNPKRRAIHDFVSRSVVVYND